MLPYLISFAISTGIIAIIQNWNRRHMGFVFWSAVALFVPCALAALRSSDIGTDVNLYVKPMYELACRDLSFSDYQRSSWWSVWHYKSPSDYEPAFAFLIWAVSRATHSFSAVLFVLQALMIVPIYLCLIRVRKNCPLWLGMAVYYLMFFNSTLNLARQWIAVSFILFAIHYLFDSKRIKYWIIILIASGFHRSALFGILIFILYQYLVKDGCGVRQVTIVGLVAILSLFVSTVLSSLLPVIGLGKYTGYLGDLDFLPNQILLRLPMLALLLAYWKKSEDKTVAAFFLGMIFLDMALSQLASANEQSGRIALYFSITAVLYIPAAVSAMGSQASRFGLGTAMMSYCVVYWVYTYVISGAGETIPYVFSGVI